MAASLPSPGTKLFNSWKRNTETQKRQFQDFKMLCEPFHPMHDVYFAIKKKKPTKGKHKIKCFVGIVRLCSTAQHLS